MTCSRLLERAVRVGSIIQLQLSGWSNTNRFEVVRSPVRVSSRSVLERPHHPTSLLGHSSVMFQRHSSKQRYSDLTVKHAYLWGSANFEADVDFSVIFTLIFHYHFCLHSARRCHLQPAVYSGTMRVLCNPD